MKTDESSTKIDLIKQEIRTKEYPQAAKMLIVSNDKSLEVANEGLKTIKALKKKIREGYDDIIQKAHKAWKATIAKRDEFLKPLEEAENIIKGKMGPYMEEQARKQREAEEAAQRAIAEAEEAERKAEEKRQKFAREALQDGDTKGAEEILAKPPEEIIPEPVDIPVAKKLEGTHTRVDWMWELEAPHIISKVPRTWLKLDEVAINAYVRKMKDKAVIPGIRIFPKTGVSSRG